MNSPKSCVDQEERIYVKSIYCNNEKNGTFSKNEALFRSRSLQFNWSSGLKSEELHTAPLTEIIDILMRKATISASALSIV